VVYIAHLILIRRARMFGHKNVENCRRIFDEAFNQGKMGIIAEVIDPNYSFNGSSAHGRAVEETTGWVEMIRTAMPDLHFTLEDIFGHDDKVAFRWRLQGTNTGSFQGMAPTGKSINITGTNIVTFKDGKAITNYQNWDEFGFKQQLGLIPQATGAGQ
jgi:predicted ester cyclase